MIMQQLKNIFLGTLVLTVLFSAMVVGAAPQIKTGPLRGNPDSPMAIKEKSTKDVTSTGVDAQKEQDKIMSNPEVMAEIRAISNDPEIVEIIADPDFLQAIQSKNLKEVQANPRTAQFMANPKIRALMEKIQAVLIKN